MNCTLRSRNVLRSRLGSMISLLACASLVPTIAIARPVGTVDLQRTGQLTSYRAQDDGDIRAGVSWSAKRFTDQGDGTLLDTLTGLMWLKDANCADSAGYDPDNTGDGHVTWTNAQLFPLMVNAGSLDISNCANYSATYDDWRLPSVNELDSLNNFETFGIHWTVDAGFVNVPQFDDYWSSTVSPLNICTHFYTSNAYPSWEENPRWAILVRSTNFQGPVRIWKTGQTIVCATGDDGDLRRGYGSPIPRFHDSGDGTVTDRLTGLMWLKEANCARVIDHDPNGTGLGLLTWEQSLSFVAGINSGIHDINGCSSYNADYDDWRLPNVRELRSLLDYSQQRPALPTGHPFVGVEFDPLAAHYYASSTTYSLLTENAMQVSFSYPDVVTFPKEDIRYYAWPVRSIVTGIVVEKRSLPRGDESLFGFTGDLSGSIQDSQRLVAEVTPGLHEVFEMVPAGWSLTSVVCDDSDSAGDIESQGASFTVNSGEVVRCVFLNCSDATPPTLILSGGSVASGEDAIFEACDTIIVEQFVTESGSEVQFLAGRRIILRPGVRISGDAVIGTMSAP